MSEPNEAIERLRTYLEQFGASGDDLWAKLADAWGELFSGGDTRMTHDKLRGRIENPVWNPPVLTFTIDRYGGTVLGATRDPIHEWVVDLDAQTAKPRVVGFRQHTPVNKSLDVKPIAARIVAAVKARADDPALRWSKDRSSVLVLAMEAVNPDNTFKQTLKDRRKRLNAALKPELANIGWHPTRQPDRYKYVG